MLPPLDAPEPALAAEYAVDGEVFRVRARRQDLFYGHGLKLSIFAADGQLWTRTAFTCDPRGPGYAACQRLDSAGLLVRAVARLETGAHARLADARARGARVGLVLNAAPRAGGGAGMPE